MKDIAMNDYQTTQGFNPNPDGPRYLPVPETGPTCLYLMLALFILVVLARPDRGNHGRH